MKLDKSFHNDFKRGSKEVYRVEALNVGEIELVELNARPAWITLTTEDPDWFVEKV